MGALVGGLFLLLLSFGAFLNFSEFKAPWLLASGILLMVLAIICIKQFFSRVFRKERKFEKREEKQRIEEDKWKREADKGKCFKSVVHLGGLEVPQNCEGVIWLKGRELIMEFNGDKAILNIDRIKDVEGKQDILHFETYKRKGRIKKMAAIAAWGGTGAIWGAIPTVKEKEAVITYATITYLGKSGELKKIVFKDTENTFRFSCTRLVVVLNSLIKREPKENRTIEL